MDEWNWDCNADGELEFLYYQEELQRQIVDALGLSEELLGSQKKEFEPEGDWCPIVNEYWLPF